MAQRLGGEVDLLVLADGSILIVGSKQYLGADRDSFITGAT